MVDPLTLGELNNLSVKSAFALTLNKNGIQDILPAQSIPDQRVEDAGEEFMQRVAAETSLVFVCHPGNGKCMRFHGGTDCI